MTSAGDEHCGGLQIGDKDVEPHSDFYDVIKSFGITTLPDAHNIRGAKLNDSGDWVELTPSLHDKVTDVATYDLLYYGVKFAHLFISKAK